MKGKSLVKELNPIAFIVLLIGACAGIAYGIYELTVTIRVFALGVRLVNLAFFETVFESAGMPNIVDIFFKAVYGLIILAYTIFILIYVIFILRLLKNKAGPRPQGYMSPVFVISIISAAHALFSIFSGDTISIISLVIDIAVIAGCLMQNYMSKPELDEPAPAFSAPADPEETESEETESKDQ